MKRVAIEEMVSDGHTHDKIRTDPFLMMRYTGQLEDVEVASPTPDARTPARWPKSSRRSRRSMARSTTAFRATAQPVLPSWSLVWSPSPTR